MCDCFDRVLGRVTGHVIEHLPMSADRSTLEVTWKNKVFRLDGKNGNVMIPVSVEYWRLKADDTRRKNKTREETSMSMTYCPFCGVKFNEED